MSLTFPFCWHNNRALFHFSFFLRHLLLLFLFLFIIALLLLLMICCLYLWLLNCNYFPFFFLRKLFFNFSCQFLVFYVNQLSFVDLDVSRRNRHVNTVAHLFFGTFDNLHLNLVSNAPKNRLIFENYYRFFPLFSYSFMQSANWHLINTYLCLCMYVSNNFNRFNLIMYARGCTFQHFQNRKKKTNTGIHTYKFVNVINLKFFYIHIPIYVYAIFL